MAEHKHGKKTYEYLFFFFHETCSKSPSCNRIAQFFLELQSVLIAAAIIVATNGKKTLH